MTAPAPSTKPATVYLAEHWPALQKHHRSLAAHNLLVVCLCAEWCSVCRDFKPEFGALARQHPEALFAYLDIEDDEAFIGALELDDFPTIAVFRGDALVFFGVVKAQRGNMTQLLRKLSASPFRPLTPPPALQPLCKAVTGAAPESRQRQAK